MVLFSVGSIVSACLRLVVGTAALLLVKNTTWTRRLIGGGIFFLGSVTLMVLTPLVSILITQTSASASDQMTASTIVQCVLNSLFLAAVFCAWNIARNRRWWILLIGVGLAVVITVARMLIVNGPVADISPSGALGAAIQGGWLILVFGSLGFFHLLGRIRGATVHAARSAPSSQQGYPQSGYPPPQVSYPAQRPGSPAQHPGYPTQPRQNQDPNHPGSRPPH